MPQLEVTIIVKQDGVPVFDTPLVKRLTVTQVESVEDAQRTPAGGFATLSNEIADVRVAVVQSDQPLDIKLNAGATVACRLNPGGLFVLVDGVINAGVATNVTAQNAGSVAANVSALVAGS